MAYIRRRYFAWKNELDAPDRALHAREDEAVFDCKIFDKEGEYPQAELEILNPYKGLGSYPKEWGLISFDVVHEDGTVEWVPFFQGKLQEWPISIRNDFITINLKNEPSDAIDRREDVLAPARVIPFYDLAFLGGSEDPVDKPEVSLEARAALVHWDRLDGAASLVSIIDAPDTFEIGENWFGDSLKFTSDPSPLDVVSVRAVVQWTHPVRFDYPYVVFGRTMTPRSIEKGFPKPGTSLGNGYTVKYSFYAEGPFDTPMYYVNHSKTATGGLGNLGRVQQTNAEYVQRLSFIAQITVAVAYDISRVERARVDVVWNGQTSAPQKRGRVRVIPVQISGYNVAGYRPYRPNTEYREGDIVLYAGAIYSAVEDFTSSDSFGNDQAYAPPPDYINEPRWQIANSSDDLRAGSTIFGTPRGYQLTQHLALIGHAELAKSRRHINVEVPMPFADALGAKASMMGHVVGPFPGRDATGKIVSIDFVTNASDEQATIRMKSVPGTGEDAIGSGSEGGGEIDRDIYYGTDPSNIYTPASKYQAGGVDLPRPSWWPAEYSWPPRMQEDPLGLYVYSQRPPMANPFNPPGGFPAVKPSWWPGIGDYDYYSWPPVEGEGVFGYLFSSESSSTMAASSDDEDDDALTEDVEETWDGDDYLEFYEGPAGGWGPRPDASLYPPERSWPPVKEEDSLGLYTRSFSYREANGFYYEVLPPAGRQPLLTIDPYVEPDGGWPPQPSWWTHTKDYGSGITFDFSIGTYPPTREEDIWGLYRIAPDRDQFAFPDDPDEDFDGTFVKPSPPKWDWLGLPDTNFPVQGIITDVIKNEIIYSGDEQDYILRSANHGFWGGAGPIRQYPRPEDANQTAGPRHPTPPEDGFTPGRWLPEMETSIEFTCRDMSGFATDTGYKMRVLWNGPKHVNVRASSYDS